MNSDYYMEMARRNRLIPIRDKGKLIGIITFFIDNDVDRFIHRKPWTVVEDNPEGNTVYIDQLVGKKGLDEVNSIRVWRMIKSYLQGNFRNVKYMRWNRWKQNRVFTYKEELDV